MKANNMGSRVSSPALAVYELGQVASGFFFFFLRGCFLSFHLNFS